MAPWQLWFLSKYGWNESRDLGDSRRNDTPTWLAILQGLENFRDITTVSVHSGSTTSFWLDLWMGDCNLAQCFLAIFSNTLRPHAFVATVFLADNPQLFLRNRLSSIAASDLNLLLEVME